MASQRDYEEAIQAVIGAYTIEGSHPDYHHEQQKRLAKEWVTLDSALKRLVAIAKEMRNA